MEDAGEHTVEYAESGDATATLVGAKIGRYQLLELVGSGGMGMVWGAWDPELERRVALKLVRIVADGARERMLREGQVLARLSHPNVVPIYDVGVMGTQVYLVMEWVRGETLRDFADGKPTERDLLDAYRQAGAGLAAAHDAGVVHRDFKPANAIRGEDGRVRVLDFGIAADEASTEAPAAGTPRYMAPEQRIGDVATTASDQYAFGISLLEAFGPDATPGWISTIIERSTDPEPTKRFPSMQALVDELARDPARRRRRAVVGIALVGAALGAFAIGRSGVRDAAVIEPCSGAATELAGSWNPAVRDRVVAHLRTLGPLAEGDKLAAELDAYGRAWVGVHERVCQANERKELTPALYETRLTCLARTRSQLATVGELLSTIEVDALPEAIRAARSLPDVEGCADIASAIIPPPAAMAERVKDIVPEIERALVLATAKRSDAASIAHHATEKARATGYEPLVARALLVEGRAQTADVTVDGREIFREAMTRALRVSDDVLATEAYARWIYELTRWGVTDIGNWDAMREIASRVGRDGRFARALMYSNRGIAAGNANDKSEARASFEEARTAAGDLEDLELLAIPIGLAQLETDPDAYAARLRPIHARLAATLGSDHPDTLAQGITLALLEPDRASAQAQMKAIAAAYGRWQDFFMERFCSFESAMLAIDAGDREQASALMTTVLGQARALEIRASVLAVFLGTPADPDIVAVIAAAYLAHEPSTRAERTIALERAIAANGNAPWRLLEAVDGWIILERWSKAYELFRSIEQPVYYARRRAQIQRGLAGALAASAPLRAQELAQQARAFYNRDPSASAARAELDSILTDFR